MKQIAVILFLLFTINNIYAQNEDPPYTGWLETETEHFKIIYEEISVDSVIEITDFCEEVYNSVTTFFNSYPEKIVLVIHDRIDTSNGSYYPAPPHINMYVSPPSIQERGARVDNWLRFLLIHELTHYVNMTIEKGLFYQLSRFLGDAVSSIPGGLMPGWAIEGIAVKLESDFTGGSRGNNPFFEMYSKALIMEDKLFSWRQAAYSSYHPPLSRIYVAGYIINDYLARNYGNDIFVKIYREYLNFPLLGFNHYVKKITGKSISKIFEQMELELKEKYSNNNPGPHKLLSPDKESNYYLPVITDKGWIIYRETEDKEPALVMFDPVSRKETILIKTTLSDYTSYTASKNGNYIFFTSLDIDGNHPSGLRAMSNLYVLDRISNNITKITNNAHIKQPVISPDGKKLAAIQNYGQHTRLVEIDIITGNVKILFEIKGSSIFNPDFSHDGEKIVFEVQDTTGRHLHILDKNNKLISIAPDITGDIYNPLFMDNGNIVFVSDIDGSPALYEIEMTEKRNLKKLFSDPVGLFSGFIYNNNIVYSTYSYRGYTLRTAPYTEIPAIGKNVIFQDRRKLDNAEPLPQNINLENSRKYTDLPKLVAFTPIPFYINPVYESTQIFGPGVTAYFRSILGKSELFTTLTLDTSMIQPGASIDFSYNWGPIGLNYSLLQGYLEKSTISNALQTTEQQLIFSIPVLNYSKLGNYTYLGLFTGILDNHTISSNKDFSFFSPDPDSYIDYYNKAYLLNGLNYSFTRIKSRGDLISPFNISSSTILYTPVSTYFLKQYALKSINSINLPSPVDHQVFKFSTRFTYSEIETLKYLNNPRGFYISSNSDIEILTSADYLFTLVRPDWPILGGLSLQGISGSLHLEKLFSVQNYELIIDENYYTGIEFILLGNYINVFESAGIGVSYRIQSGSSSFNPENLGIYLFIGTNSFK